MKINFCIIYIQIIQVKGDWRNLHNEKLHNVYAYRMLLDNKIREDKMGGACDKYGAENKCVQSFSGES
jgi:hypothetical protein